MTRKDRSYEIIHKILLRAKIMFPDSWLPSQTELMMAHLKNPLRLKDFLEADDFNFAHDILGITKYLNRKTWDYNEFFLPRFSE